MILIIKSLAYGFNFFQQAELNSEHEGVCALGEVFGCYGCEVIGDLLRLMKRKSL